MSWTGLTNLPSSPSTDSQVSPSNSTGRYSVSGGSRPANMPGGRKKGPRPGRPGPPAASGNFVGASLQSSSPMLISGGLNPPKKLLPKSFPFPLLSLSHLPWAATTLAAASSNSAFRNIVPMAGNSRLSARVFFFWCFLPGRKGQIFNIDSRLCGNPCDMKGQGIVVSCGASAAQHPLLHISLLYPTRQLSYLIYNVV